jgi:hypothetical protein
MDLTFVNLTEKPELTAAMWAVHSTWPEFMLHDLLADRYYPRLAATFPEHQILGVAADGKIVTRINSVPVQVDQQPAASALARSEPGDHPRWSR